MVKYNKNHPPKNTHSHVVSTSQKHPNLNILYSNLQATLKQPSKIHTLSVYSPTKKHKIILDFCDMREQRSLL